MKTLLTVILVVLLASMEITSTELSGGNPPNPNPEVMVTLLTSVEGSSEVEKSTTKLSPPIDTTADADLTEKQSDPQAPRQVRMLLSKGKEYFGFVIGKDKVMHGQGTLKYADGTIYEGNFAHNKRHGRGRIRYASGEEYRGDWYNGFMTGKGTYNFQDGSVYEVCLDVFRN